MSTVWNQPVTSDSAASTRRRSPRFALFRFLTALVLGLGALAACSSDNKAASSGSSGNTAVNQILDDGVKAQNNGQLDVTRQKYLDVIQKDPTNKIAFYDLG